MQSHRSNDKDVLYAYQPHIDIAILDRSEEREDFPICIISFHMKKLGEVHCCKVLIEAVSSNPSLKDDIITSYETLVLPINTLKKV